MLSIDIIITILALHYLGDFLLQSDKIATTKSSSNKSLSIHILLYTSILMLMFNPLWAILNGAIHFCIDYVTSRLSSHLWKEGRVHEFFLTIGMDQLLHYITLFGTYYLLTV